MDLSCGFGAVPVDSDSDSADGDMGCEDEEPVEPLPANVCFFPKAPVRPHSHARSFQSFQPVCVRGFLVLPRLESMMMIFRT